MPRDGATIFGDLIGKLDVLRVACNKCGRAGRWRLRQRLQWASNHYYPHGLPLPTLMTAQQQVPATQANPAPTSRAQAQSPIYVVIAIQKITDPEAYKPLPEKGKAAAEAAGGHYIIRTGNITGLDGVAPERLALIEFDSIEKAQAWYKSAAQKDADTIRAKSTDSLAFIVEGLGK